MTEVAELVETHAGTSSRRASAETGISRRSIQRILHDLGLKSYRLKILQQLEPDDCDRRIEFASWALEKMTADEAFLFTTIFSDEAIFHTNGRVNKQNVRIRSRTNPEVIAVKPLHSEKVVVWGAISSLEVYGPFFFEGTVNGENYRQMLEEFFIPKLNGQNECWFQQDGAPPHFALCVRERLNEHFCGRWIGRRGAKEWPPRSPDLTPLDFWFWGHIKEIVYRERIVNVEHLKTRISAAFENVNEDKDLMHRVAFAFRHRMQLCLNCNGGHIEQLKNIHMSEEATSDVDEDLEEEDSFEDDNVYEN